MDGRWTTLISIHALREEGDSSTKEVSSMAAKFLSTPSARRATSAMVLFTIFSIISIHALREEGDSPAPGMSCTQHNFYPRPPRGGRPMPSRARGLHGNFYPRPPRGGRRSCAACGRISSVFLSTPSARRATWKGLLVMSVQTFLSTPSARRATGLYIAFKYNILISIHALREEGDG